MHKIRYTTILLLAVFCIIPIVSILMIHHLTLTDTLSKMGSGTLGKSATIMKIDKLIFASSHFFNNSNTSLGVFQLSKIVFLVVIENTSNMGTG